MLIKQLTFLVGGKGICIQLEKPLDVHLMRGSWR